MKSSLYSFLVSALLLGVLGPQFASEVNMVKVHVDPFLVIGISTRTTNARETTKDAVIPKMWARLHEEDVLTRIPNRVDAHVIAVYCDYENGKDGLYNYVLGAKAKPTKSIPPGMVAQKIVPGEYAVFTDKGGPPPQMIVNLWKQIWSLEKPGQLERAYQTDYEVYYGDLRPNPPNAHVAIYIGLAR